MTGDKTALNIPDVISFLYLSIIVKNAHEPSTCSNLHNNKNKFNNTEFKISVNKCFLRAVR